MLLGIGSVAGAQVTLTPDSIELTLGPGETHIEEKLVTIPGGDPSIKVDVYFLADTTGSMGSVLANVRTNAQAVLDELSGKIDDIQFGVGEYKDFPFDPFCFRNNTSMTDNEAAILAGINLWVASGGADGSEGQLFALDRIADAGDPFGIGFRPDAQKIIVWFGDAPGHDPVCAAISGLGSDITENTVRTKLTDGNFTVIAIGTTTGFANELDDDPQISDGDYTPFCVLGGSPGQATRITDDTNGVYLENVPPADVAQAICDAVVEVTADVTVALVPAGATAPYTTVLTPPYVDVPLPPEGEVLELVFEVQFSGDCVPGSDGTTLLGTVDCLVDGANAAQQDVTLHLPPCVVCFTMDLETDDTGSAMPHGARVDSEFDGDGAFPTALGSVNLSGMNTLAILDSNTGPAMQDPDLLVGSGNVLILQTDANTSECPPASGVFCTHNDDEDGGVMSFSWGDTPITAMSVALVDVDDDADWAVVLVDAAGATRVYTVPGGWTGDLVDDGAGFGRGVLDLMTLADQPGAFSTATAAEDAGFDPDAVVEIRVVLGGSGGVDDLSWCMAGGEMPQAAVRTRNGSGVNTVDLTSGANPRMGSVWLASLDCSALGTGLATLSVSPEAVDGVPTIYGERLIGGSLLLRSQQLFGGGATSFAWTLPIDPALVGLEVHAQGLCWSAESASRPKLRRLRGAFSNALDMILGF